MSKTEMCRQCGKQSLEQSPSKRQGFFECRLCGAEFALMKDQNAPGGKRFISIDVNHREDGLAPLSTRAGIGTLSDPIRYDPDEGYVFAHNYDSSSRDDADVVSSVQSEERSIEYRDAVAERLKDTLAEMVDEIRQCEALADPNSACSSELLEETSRLVIDRYADRIAGALV